MSTLSRYIVVAVLLSQVGLMREAGAAIEVPPPRPPRNDLVAVEKIIEQAKLTGRTSAILFDLTSGEILDSYADDFGHVPASTIKIATAGWALQVLGNRFSFETLVRATGPINDGVVEGDLVLVGGGDPSLNTWDLIAMIESLRERGVRTISGRFLYDDRDLPARRYVNLEQPDYAAYNPGLGGLNLNQNQVWMTVQWESGIPNARFWARAGEHELEIDAIAADVRLDARQRIFSHRRHGGREIWEMDYQTFTEFSGRWLPVRYPGRFAAVVFRRLAERAGIDLPEPEKILGPAEGEVVARHRSESLAQLAAEMLRYADNLAAEVIGMEAAVVQNGDVEAASHDTGGLVQWISGAELSESLRIDNFSGLTDKSRMSARDFYDLLSLLAGSGSNGDDIRYLIPRSLFWTESDSAKRGAAAIVQAESGTLQYIRAVAGYMRLLDTGREFGFAILSSNLPRRREMSRFWNQPVPVRGFSDATDWNQDAYRLEQQILKSWVRQYSWRR